MQEVIERGIPELRNSGIPDMGVKVIALLRPVSASRYRERLRGRAVRGDGPWPGSEKQNSNEAARGTGRRLGGRLARLA